MISLSLESSVELEFDEENFYGATSGAGTADPPDYLSSPSFSVGIVLRDLKFYVYDL